MTRFGRLSLSLSGANWRRDSTKPIPEGVTHRIALLRQGNIQPIKEEVRPAASHYCSRHGSAYARPIEEQLIMTGDTCKTWKTHVMMFSV